MRCGCTECGTYMVHSEGLALGCVCPECGNRCTACLGTNTVISREELKRWRSDPETEKMVLDKFQQDERQGDACGTIGKWEDDEKWRG